MAKEDFCFTYYDGDAARDKAHMSRLERGAYDDIISAQRKRGHLSLDDIKRVLSKDFESCWPAMEWILLKDEEGKFFIEWVEKSITEMKKNSSRNKEQLEKYWQEVNAGLRPAPKNGRKKPETNTKEIQTYLTGIKKEIPLIDVNGDVNGDGVENKDEKLTLPKNGFFTDTLDKEILLTPIQAGATVQYIRLMTKQAVTETDVGNRWEAFKIAEFSKHQWYNDFESLLSHFRNSYKLDFKNGSSTLIKDTPTGTSAARVEALKNW